MAKNKFQSEHHGAGREVDNLLLSLTAPTPIPHRTNVIVALAALVTLDNHQRIQQGVRRLISCPDKDMNAAIITVLARCEEVRRADPAKQSKKKPGAGLRNLPRANVGSAVASYGVAD